MKNAGITKPVRYPDKASRGVEWMKITRINATALAIVIHDSLFSVIKYIPRPVPHSYLHPHRGNLNDSSNWILQYMQLA